MTIVADDVTLRYQRCRYFKDKQPRFDRPAAIIYVSRAIQMIEDKTTSFRRYYPSSVFSPERVLSDTGGRQRGGREGGSDGSLHLR